MSFKVYFKDSHGLFNGAKELNLSCKLFKKIIVKIIGDFMADIIFFPIRHFKGIAEMDFKQFLRQIFLVHHAVYAQPSLQQIKTDDLYQMQ